MPQMQWFHNGIVLEPKPRFSITTNQQSGDSALMINQISAEDAGSYQVVVENDTGRTTSTCIITLKSEYEPES